MEEKLYRCLKRLTVNHYFTDHLDIICEAHRLVREYEFSKVEIKKAEGLVGNDVKSFLNGDVVKGLYEEFGTEHTKHNEEHK